VITQVFADTSFYVSLLNRRDARHSSAVDWAARARPKIVTTEFVLLEVANFFREPQFRREFVSFLQSLRLDPATALVPCDSSWFQKGLNRFTSRNDKEWSLTDCISFVVMEETGLIQALTKAHHFEQAGFTILL
jgi:uncharacterized protein